jgi:Na+/H+ antiporter NhaC
MDVDDPLTLILMRERSLDTNAATGNTSNTIIVMKQILLRVGEENFLHARRRKKLTVRMIVD